MRSSALSFAAGGHHLAAKSSSIGAGKLKEERFVIDHKDKERHSNLPGEPAKGAAPIATLPARKSGSRTTLIGFIQRAQRQIAKPPRIALARAGELDDLSRHDFG